MIIVKNIGIHIILFVYFFPIIIDLNLMLLVYFLLKFFGLSIFLYIFANTFKNCIILKQIMPMG